MTRVTIRMRWILNHYMYSLRELFPVLKNFFMYSGGALLVRGSSAFTAPITMSILSPEHYGLLALLNSFVSIACVICGLGLRQALFLEYFHCSSEQKQESIINILKLYLLCATPLLVIGFLFRGHINQWYFSNQSSTGLIVLCLCLIFAYFFSELIYQILQYENKSLLLTSLQIGFTTLVITTTIVLLWYGNYGVASLIIGQLAGVIVVSGIGIWYSLRCITTNLRVCQLPTAKYLAQGLPFVPGMLLAWALAAGDRVLLARYLTLHDVGIYSVADLFGQLFYMTILIPFSNAYQPYLMKKFAENHHSLMDVERWNRKIMWLFLPGVTLLFSLGYLTTKPIVYRFLPPSYQEAIPYLWLILFGYLLSVASYFPAALIQFRKKTTFLASAICIPALLNVALNIMLIPHYHIMGCVFATIISYGSYFVLMLFYNQYVSRSL